jgi:TRAP-type C4-dicarboxylate transport system permease small subunit
MNLVNKILHGANLAIVVLAMVCLIAMALITITGVFLRYVFNTGLQWGEEITLVLVIWFTFIALAMGVKLNLHISISLLPVNLPVWLETLLTKIKQVCSLVVGIVFLVYGLKLSGYTLRSILPATGLPAALQYLPLPACSFLIIFDSVISLFNLEQDAHLIERKFGGEH